MRVFHGYEEGCKGVVAEKFGNLLVINHKVPYDQQLEELTEQFDKNLDVDTIITKAHQSLRIPLKHATVVRKGEFPTRGIECMENGVKYDIKAHASHNIGLYLDTREARKWLKAHSDGRRVLNLFAFTGSLGLCSQVGGAEEVVHLDKSAELLPRLKANYELNGLNWDNRSFLRGDIYKHLPRAQRSGKKFGGIILDPPPKVYASSHASNKPKGQDFRQLVGLCSELLVKDGWLMCFFHRFDKTREEFEKRGYGRL